MMNNKHIGVRSEYFLKDVLRDRKIPYKHMDSWYDFEIMGEKVELKSCRISVKHTYQRKNGVACESYRIGRFNFDLTAMEKAIKENIWICLLVRHYEQFMILGMVRAKHIGEKRYLTIHKAREFNLIDLEEWIEGRQLIKEEKT